MCVRALCTCLRIKKNEKQDRRKKTHNKKEITRKEKEEAKPVSVEQQRESNELNEYTKTQLNSK